MFDVCHDDELKPSDIEAIVITCDGLMASSGGSLVVAYAEAMGDHGIRSRILSFETTSDLGDERRRHSLQERLESKGIEWTSLPHHQRFPVVGTLVNVVAGMTSAISMARARQVQVVHARSYLPGIIGYSLKLFFDARLLFDMGGFLPEERVEQQVFRPQGMFYRASKRCERFLLGIADHVVVMTEKAKAILRDREAAARMVARRSVRETPISVIPNCTDLARFQPAPVDHELKIGVGLADHIVIGNVGAADKRYMLPEMFRFAFHIKSHRPETRFVYVNGLNGQDASPVHAAAREAGLGDEDVVVVAVEPEDVPRWLTLFRLGVFFLRPSYAAKASSYPELADFLACGVPVVTNTGVGDVDVILSGEKAGVLAKGLTENDLEVAARRTLSFLDGHVIPERVVEACRATASACFALDEGAKRFAAIYRALAAPSVEEPRASVVAEVG